MKVYKRVRNHSGTLVSAFCEDKSELTYSTDEDTIPKVGKVFAFRTVESARNFCLGNETWEAEANGVEEFNFPTFMGNRIDIGRFMRSFWRGRFGVIRSRGKYKDRPSQYDGRPPDGTVLCSSLRLIKKVS